MERILTVICAILLLVGLALGIGFWYRHKMMNQIVGIQPYMIMVDDIRYRSFGPMPTEKPEGAPDGTVHQVSDPADYPDENGEANFGKAGMPYWKVPLGICVYMDENYILLRD